MYLDFASQPLQCTDASFAPESDQGHRVLDSDPPHQTFPRPLWVNGTCQGGARTEDKLADDDSRYGISYPEWVFGEHVDQQDEQDEAKERHHLSGAPLGCVQSEPQHDE